MKSGSVVITGVLASSVSVLAVWALFVGLSSGVEGAEIAVAVVAGNEQPAEKSATEPPQQDMLQPPPAAESLSGQPEPDGSLRVDINTASRRELEALPGIGPVLADRIIEYRSEALFEDVSELKQVRGIGPKKLATLSELVTVGAVSAAHMQ